MNKRDKLKIAMIGAKGIPARFGGIERHVEEISTRLSDAGHEVTVYGREPFSEPGRFRGVRVKILPSVKTKNLDAATSSLISSFHALLGSYDIVHYHGIGPSIFSPLIRLGRKKIVCTIHAPDYRQVKWGRFAKFMLARGEKTAATLPDRSIAVSRLMTERLKSRYGTEVEYIPNGATVKEKPRFSIGERFGIEKGKYLLAVGRFIFEKGFTDLLEGYRSVDSNRKLVLVGDLSSAEDEYRRELERRSDSRTVFTGFQTGEILNQLYAHCSFYILPSYVEGLPITLIEAMSFGCPLLISDIPENTEVAGTIAETFRCGDTEDLKKKLRRMLSLTEEEREKAERESIERVKSSYNWESITRELEKIYLE